MCVCVCEAENFDINIGRLDDYKVHTFFRELFKGVEMVYIDIPLGRVEVEMFPQNKILCQQNLQEISNWFLDNHLPL